MSNPKIGRAVADRAAQRPRPMSTEVLDDNPVRAELDLTDAEREALEAEKVTLLARLPGYRPSVPVAVETLGEVEQEHETVIETSALSPEDATEVVGPLADHVTSKEIAAMIAEEMRTSAEAEAVAVQMHKDRLAALLVQQAEAEAREARAIEAGVSARLRTAVEALHQGNTSAVRADDRTANEIIREEQEKFRRAAEDPIRRAGLAKKELLAFEREYGPSLDELSRTSPLALEAGLPRPDSAGVAGINARNLVTNLLRLVEQARDLLSSSLRTIEDRRAVIRSLIENPAKWSGGINSNGLRNQATWKEFNTALRDLGLPTEALPTLQATMRGITGSLESIADLRARYADRPELTSAGPGAGMQRPDQIETAMATFRPPQTRAETAVDLFHDGRRTEQ